MKKIKHTNGPWLISTIDGEDCLMVGGGDGSEVVADIRTHQPAGEVEANAHLISSAPELLAALIEAVKQLDGTPYWIEQVMGKGSPAITGINATCAKAWAVIAKAEGVAHAEGRELGMEVEA